jgi:hypothetical protein
MALDVAHREELKAFGQSFGLDLVGVCDAAEFARERTFLQQCEATEQPRLRGWLSCYFRGQAYHIVLEEKLSQLVRWLESRVEGARTLVHVDDRAPIVSCGAGIPATPNPRNWFTGGDPKGAGGRDGAPGCRRRLQRPGGKLRKYIKSCSRVSLTHD